MKRQEFCKWLGIPYRTVQDWELGNRQAPFYVFNLIKEKVERDLPERNERKASVLDGNGKDTDESTVDLATDTAYSSAEHLSEYAKSYSNKLRASRKNLGSNMVYNTNTVSLPLYLLWNMDFYC